MELQAVLDFIYPPQCAACEAVGSGLCDECFPRMAPVVSRSGAIAVYALGSYEGALKRAVLALKNGRRDVARALAERLQPLIDDDSIIVPVPTTAARRRQRGFDGCELIATVAAARRAHVIAGLRQVAGDAQRGRTRDARLAARGRFIWRAQPLCGQSVVLLDDVVTTGATLADCAWGIERAGGAISHAVVIALA